MFTALVLICSAGVPHLDCTQSTALVVQRLPGNASMQQCLFLGEAEIAPTMIAPRKGEYAKVVCRSRDAQPTESADAAPASGSTR